jgi:NAD(P)-dependent dehydrogenase (short-subunit alcohol dehydrogenase family)
MTDRYDGWFMGRTALVTGGGSGIGAALARALVAAGADVRCTDVDGPTAERVAAEASGPGSASSGPLDVTDAAAVQAAVDDVVAESGRLDLLFNNAGILFGGPTEQLSLDQWNAIIDVNLRAVVHGVAAAYPHMIAAGRGYIVNTASLGGLAASGMVTSYVATKHAVVGLSLALRTEATGHGVGVTVVCPSSVETPILDKGGVGGFDGRDFFVRGQGLKRASSADLPAADTLRAITRDRIMLVWRRRARLVWLANRAVPGLMQKMGARHMAGQQAKLQPRAQQVPGLPTTPSEGRP